MGEAICTLEWMPVTLGGSHADYRLCRKELVDSVNSASPLPVVEGIPNLYLQSFLELVSSSILVTGDFSMVPFSLGKKKK